LKFVEGKQNKKGGWFAESPKIEVLVNGAWIVIDAVVSPVYPDNSIEAHGDSFQPYRFTFDEVTCEGVRIIGKAGGTDPYISVGELIPRYHDVSSDEEFDNVDVPIAICSVIIPTGSGSKDIRLMHDGVIDNKNYDTYNGMAKKDAEFFGYMFRSARNVSTVSFTEGLHFSNGGWFKNGDISVEVFIDGEWQKVETTVSPAYPNGDSQDIFGASFETYTFTLTESKACDGVRISGTAGGGGFVSINELVIG
jgi:hypothetical protein